MQARCPVVQAACSSEDAQTVCQCDHWVHAESNGCVLRTKLFVNFLFTSLDLLLKVLHTCTEAPRHIPQETSLFRDLFALALQLLPVP
jgi:hypothetical protein